jgi:hypothetical protein
MIKKAEGLLINLRRSVLILIALFVTSVGFTPLINWGYVSAAALTQRSVTIASALPSDITSYTFSFVPGTTSAIQSLEFQGCTTAVGTCTAPSGLSFTSASGGTVSGWSNATNFTVDNTGANNCTPAANELCANRTQAGSESASGAHNVIFNNITNPNGNSCSNSNCTFFIRVTTFSTTNYTTGGLIDTGTVASSTTQVLTVSAVIQEQLSFCIGATTVNDAVTATPVCSSITGTSLSLGTISPNSVSISPVSATNNGSASNGLAELSTNASNGATVSYNAIQQSGTNHLGALRVAGATCNAGVVNTDQCINSVGVTKATLTSGTENFGMSIAGVNCANVSGYTCSFASGTFNLNPTTNYNCNGTANGGHANTYPTSDTNQISGTTTCSYAWDETGTSQTIASSTTIVGGESLILKFAATPNLVTPTGAYTAQANFVATPTF